MSRILLNKSNQITNNYKNHTGWSHGIDVVALKNSLCYITAHTRGQVIKVVNYIKTNSYKGENVLDNEGMGYGNYVIIKHKDTVCTLYAHLNPGSVTVKEGDIVDAGQVIGFMGSTGHSFGAHLHFEIRIIDDMKYYKELHNTNYFHWIDPEPYINSDLPIKYFYNGLDYSLVFEPIFYSNRYSDLKKAFGYNADKLFDHFIKYGMKEHRQAISTFNVNAYKNNYKDLRDAFGDNIIAYYTHYIKHGYNEQRKGV